MRVAVQQWSVESHAAHESALWNVQHKAVSWFIFDFPI